MRRSLLFVPSCALLLGLGPQQEPPSFAHAFERFAAAVEADEPEEAVALAELWLDEPVDDEPVAGEPVDNESVEDESGDGKPAAVRAPLGERERAALRFGLGLVRGRGEDPAAWPTAVDDFQAARALAGPGALRLDAHYDAGVVELQEGERLRAQLSEIAGGAAAPQLVPPPGAPPADPNAAGEDPLPLARAAYERARAILSERLRADWQDVDTRANLELIQRRLHELDDIERRREEQEQEQQQEQDPSENQEDQEDQEQDQEQQEGENQDGEQQPSQEDPDGEEAQQNEEQEPQEGEDQPAGEEQAEPQELEGQEQGQEAQASQLQDDERHLTREEVLRLLDRLAELEEQGRQVEAALRKGQRTPVERDW